MSRRSRTLMFGALAVAVCAAAGLGIWRATDSPDAADAATEPAGAADGSANAAAGSPDVAVTIVPSDPDDGSGDRTAQPPAAGDADIRGVVTSAAVYDVTDPSQEAVGCLMVEAPKGDDVPYDRASVAITTRTLVFAEAGGRRTRVHPALPELNGKTVEVVFTGAVAESYPVQATAAYVTILD